MSNQFSVRALVRWAIAAAILSVGLVSARLWMESSFGMSIAYWLVTLLSFALVCGSLLAISIVLLALSLIFIRIMLGHSLCKAPQVALSATVFLVVSVFMPRGLASYTRLLPSVAERSAPLVDAIRRFESARGRPPGVLSELVPEYLPSIPGTGVRLAPQYEYMVGSQAYCDNPWMLSYSRPVLSYSFDSGGAQYFLPRGNYEDEKCVLPGKIYSTEAGWVFVAF